MKGYGILLLLVQPILYAFVLICHAQIWFSPETLLRVNVFLRYITLVVVAGFDFLLAHHATDIEDFKKLKVIFHLIMFIFQFLYFARQFWFNNKLEESQKTGLLIGSVVSSFLEIVVLAIGGIFYDDPFNIPFIATWLDLEAWKNPRSEGVQRYSPQSSPRKIDKNKNKK